MEHLELFAKIALVALIAGLIWWAFQPRYVFQIRVTLGQPKTIKGNVTPAFLDEIAAVCTRNEVQSGTVRGVARRGRVCLVLSRDFPPESQQQLRNWWNISGWTTTKNLS